MNLELGPLAAKDLSCSLLDVVKSFTCDFGLLSITGIEVVYQHSDNSLGIHHNAAVLVTIDNI